VQPTFQKLGIPLDTRVANALIREEPGVAARLLYSIKQNIANLNKSLTVRCCTHSACINAKGTNTSTACACSALCAPPLGGADAR
jgi:hypothetical protein